ncbi:MAG: type A2 lanthipeptide, partial [Frankia sp.]
NAGGPSPGDDHHRKEVMRMAINTVIADIEPEGRELSESELAAIIGGAGGTISTLSQPTGGSCGGCH